MKNTKYLLSCLGIFALFGCQKELEVASENNAESSAPITLNGYYNNDVLLSKSAYTLVGDVYQFEWVAADKFVAQSINGETYNQTLFSASTGGDARVPFTGTPASGYTLGDYAFYPNDGSNAPNYTNNLTYKKITISPIDPNASIESESATVNLAGTITEDKDYPMAHIPMIGEKDANGDYQFTPCTGVLKITIKNFPTTATQIRLDVVYGSYNLHGDFVFDTNKEIKSAYAKSGQSLKYLNVTASETVENRSFYIPIPTGTISANNIELSVKDGDNIWSQGLIGKSITVQKGVVTELPPVTYQSGPSVSIVGTMSAPKAKMRFGGSKTQFIVFKITDSADVPTSDLNNPNFAGKLSYSQTWTIALNNTTFFPGKATSGTKYFHYQIYKKDGNVKVGDPQCVPFLYLASSDYGVALSECTSNAPQINVTAKGELLSEVRAVITDLSESAAYAKLDASLSAADPDVLVVNSVSANNALSEPSGLKSGKRKIYIRGYNTTYEKIAFDKSFDFYYLSVADHSKFCKQHTDGRDTYYDNTALTNVTITFAPSDTPSSSNIMLTEYDGMSYNAAPPAGARFYTFRGVEEGLAFEAGYPLRGIYDPSKGFNAMNCDIIASSSGTFFTYGGQAYTLQMNGNTSGHMYFCLNRYYNHDNERYYIRAWYNEIKLRRPSIQSDTYTKGGFRTYPWDTWTEN